MEERTLIQTYRECVHLLYAFVSRRCGGDRALAEDITQEAWLRAVEAWGRDGLPKEPLAWLQTVARNLIINYFRRNHPVPMDALPPGWEPALEGEKRGTQKKEAAALIAWGLARLRPHQARVLEAFHLDGMKVAEIAVEQGLSERAVEGRLRRARRKLRKTLESAVRTKGETS